MVFVLDKNRRPLIVVVFVVFAPLEQCARKIHNARVISVPLACVVIVSMGLKILARTV
jgi:hypothetical protein|tara:strand:- start:499 stop:672 length:174 start_codon:yes stop_codon:yes gene_type:complete